MTGAPITNEQTSFDVLIIGAGISGINAAYRLQEAFPNYRYAILEARDRIGGTWDLFRYPGIRSDSDLYTFGFSWYPWNRSNPIGEGQDILTYLQDAMTTHNISPHVQFHHRVLSVEWDQQTWTVNIQHDGSQFQYTAKFLIFGTGYYDHSEPLATTIPGIENFKGDVIHPQFWPEDFDYTNKNIVIIGSGATAVTLAPKLSEKADRVTMLQRSPTYLASLPNRHSGSWLSRILPTTINYYINRMKRLIIGHLMYAFCRAYPNAARGILEKGMSKQLPPGFPLNPHFKPRYNPWEQRLCVCPNGDFFAAIRSGKTHVVTDYIETVDSDGIQLKSGQRLTADTIVTATGLKWRFMGGIPITVNGEKIDISEKYMWNGFMMQDLPNAAALVGYASLSWTLGADASMSSICRLIKLMNSKGYSVARPSLKDSSKLEPRPLLDLSSNYIKRAEGMPRAASLRPWIGRTGYFSDMWFAIFGNITKGLELSA
jgi:cation diffusion facilitator CzcD-associated flavoprotein CzcO